MDEVRKSWWGNGLPHLADSLRVKHHRRAAAARLSKAALGSDSISIARGKELTTPMDESSQQEPRTLRILRMRKRNFYINITVISILFITFLTIGLFVGLNKYNPALSSSALYPGLAVSSLNTTQANIQVFYQNATTLAIQYRVLAGTSTYSAAQTLQLGKAPKSNLSMAATSFESQNYIFHQLFYVMDSTITFVNISCPSTAPTSCSKKGEAVIPTGPSHPVASDSTVAAVYLEGGGWQVFYHSDGHHLSKISCTNGVWEKDGTMIGNKAVPGSGIAAAPAGASGSVEVLYMDEAGDSIFSVVNINGQSFSRMLAIPRPIHGSNS
jgi:hypothetical protein